MQSSISTPRRFCSLFYVTGKGVLYYELLKPGGIVTAHRYQQQLTFNDALEEKRLFTKQGNRKVIMLHDNTWPHTAEAKKQIIFALSWELSPHTIFTRYSSFRLSSTPGNTTSLSWYTLQNRKSPKKHRWLYHFEANEPLSSRDSQAIRRIAKDHW